MGLDYSCYNSKLRSLEGAPDAGLHRFLLDYKKNLPLLRLLQYKKVVFVNKAPGVVIEILKKYREAGQQGSLACAAELSGAGFKGNARW